MLLVSTCSDLIQNRCSSLFLDACPNLHQHAIKCTSLEAFCNHWSVRLCIYTSSSVCIKRPARCTSPCLPVVDHCSPWFYRQVACYPLWEHRRGTFESMSRVNYPKFFLLWQPRNANITANSSLYLKPFPQMWTQWRSDFSCFMSLFDQT